MPRTTSVTIGSHFESFINRQIAQGRYHSPSEVVQAGLRLLEEREAKRDVLRAALVGGEQSGEAAPFDFDAFIASKRAVCRS